MKELKFISITEITNHRHAISLGFLTINKPHNKPFNLRPIKLIIYSLYNIDKMSS